MDFVQLAGRMTLGLARTKDFTDWAEDCLAEGIDTENIAILAGLGLERDPDAGEVQRYFEKCLADLGLTLPGRSESLKDCAALLCRQILGGEIPPQTGLRQLEPLFPESQYDPLYGIWEELGDDIAFLEQGEVCFFNSDLSQENIEPFIKAVARQFLELLKMDLPDDFFQLAACRHCGHIGVPADRRLEKAWLPEFLFRVIFRRGPALYPVCARCQSPYPRSMSDLAPRQRYLEMALPATTPKESWAR